MARKQLFRTADFPYHVVNRSNNMEFFYLNLPELWNLSLELLSELILKFNVKIHAFVLMSNHYHLIASTPDLNLDEAILHFQRELARKANKICGRTNHFFGGRYKWCLIQSEKHYWNALKYVFRNPVAVNLCHQVQDFPFSSLNCNLSKDTESPNWQLVDFFHDKSKEILLDLDWLNYSFSERQSEAIGKAMRKRIFKISADETRKIVELDEPQYKKGRGT